MICQDRLGTDVRKLKQRGVFRTAGAAGARVDDCQLRVRPRYLLAVR
jgi:hypothetical protein